MMKIHEKEITMMSCINDKNLLIITHFPPWKVGTSHPKFKFQPEYITNYFASDMLNYIPINNKITTNKIIIFYVK